MLCEMQLVSSRIWTRIAVSISYDGNHYTFVSDDPLLFITLCLNSLWSMPQLNYLLIASFMRSWLLEKKTVFTMWTIIIILSCHQHGYPWPSLATPHNRLLLPAGLQVYIPYRHRAAVCRFELVVLPLLVHVKESTGAHHLWASPYFSSSVLHVLFV